MREAVASNAVIESALATLQPLRDLSRNWDVDIASCLEEYLQELGAGDLVSPAEPSEEEKDGQSIPNFAHAALILQNSSNVYTRKVDYLHGLVYKALYEFCKTTSTGKDQRRKSTNDPDIDDFYDFDPHMNFLLLDDVIPEDYTNTKINLKSDEIEDLESDGTTPNQSKNRTRLSLGGLSVTKLERSLNGGFNSSAQQRALLGTINSGSLRLVGGCCDVGDNGLLLMPGSNLLTPAMAEEGGMGETSSSQQEPNRFLFGEGAMGSPGLQDNNFDNDDDHSNDGAGFEMNFDDDEDMNQQTAPQEEVVGTTLLEQKRKKTVTFAEAATRDKKRVNPWALLDPHSQDDFRKPKPLRRGKTIRLPQGVDKLPSECVTGARTRQTKQRPRQLQPKEETRNCLAVETFQSLLGNRHDLPKIPLNGLVFEEFSYIAKRKAKQRATERRAERKKEMEAQNLHEQAEALDYDDDEDYGGGFDFGGVGDDDDDFDDNHGNAGMASLDDAFESNFHNDGDDESNLGKTFEELCRAHIRAFAKGAEEFAINTQLSVRVDKWQAKLAPILEEEERRSAFDIHMYSQKLIDSAEQGRQKRKSDGSMQAVESKTVDFESVTKLCTQSDVCRLFLASLSLANSGNLKIEEGNSTFRFDIISSNIEMPMETFIAPSLVQEG